MGSVWAQTAAAASSLTVLQDCAGPASPRFTLLPEQAQMRQCVTCSCMPVPSTVLVHVTLLTDPQLLLGAWASSGLAVLLDLVWQCS